MYKIFADDQLLFHPYIEELKLQNAVVDLKQNDIGTFKFTMQADHPNINDIKERRSIITVVRDDELLFRGVALTDELTFKNARTVQCKEYPYFLTYSVQRPYSYTGDVRPFLEQIIAAHNAQVEPEHRFEVGIVTVQDSNNNVVRADSTYMTTWETIQKKLIDLLGGYLRFRYQGGVQYIDYLDDFTTQNSQEVNFGENLIDLSQARDSLDIYTVLIPQGATIEDAAGEAGTEKRVGIASVNDGKDYIQDDAAVRKIGRIEHVETWDDVTDPGNLLIKAHKQLLKATSQANTIELKAIDLAHIKKSIEWFHMGNYIKVISKKNNVNDYFLPMEMQINLFNVGQNSITLNTSKTSLTGLQVVSEANAKQQLINTKKEYDDKLNNYPTKAQVSSQITQTAEEINTEVRKKVGKTEVISSINQSAEEISINADKINLNGAVSANGYFKIGTDGKVDITGGEVRMGDMTGDGIQTTLNPKGLLAQTKSGKVVNITGNANNWESPLLIYEVGSDGNADFSKPVVAISNNYIDMDNWKKASQHTGKFRIDKTGSQPKAYIYTTMKADGTGYNSENGALAMGYYGFDTWDLQGVNSRYTAGSMLIRGDTLYDGSSNMAFEANMFRNDGDPEVGAYGCSLYVDKELRVHGTKNRVVDTEHFGTVLQNALETPVPTFEDYGEGTLDDTGACRIYLDNKFLETIDHATAFNVFLTKYGEGDIYVIGRQEDGFDVKGTPGLKFSWQVLATQKDYNGCRLEEARPDVGAIIENTSNGLESIGLEFISEYERGLEE